MGNPANDLARGIHLIGADPVITGRAKSAGLSLETGVLPAVPFAKTLIVQAGTRVPFDLLLAAWSFLDRWDAAVPFWRSGVTAADVGTPAERKLTAAVALDLRVPLHTVELLFVRAGGAGEELVDRWLAETSGGGDRRLAFLRALHLVKPRLCILPTTWLAEVHEYERRPAARGQPRGQPSGRPLVRVEVAPGRYVKAHAGDEEKVLEHFRRTQSARR